MGRPRAVPAALLLALAACAATGAALPSAGDLSRATGLEESVFREGRRTMVMECDACHRMYWPHEYPASEWSKIAPRMGGRAGLDDDAVRNLTRYLEAASRYAREADSRE